MSCGTGTCSRKGQEGHVSCAGVQGEDECFLCGNEEGFPVEMLELDFKEVQALSSGHGSLGREKSMSKGMRLAGLVG